MLNQITSIKVLFKYNKSKVLLMWIKNY